MISLPGSDSQASAAATSSVLSWLASASADASPMALRNSAPRALKIVSGRPKVWSRVRCVRPPIPGISVRRSQSARSGGGEDVTEQYRTIRGHHNRIGHALKHLEDEDVAIGFVRSD